MEPQGGLSKEGGEVDKSMGENKWTFPAHMGQGNLMEH